MRTWLRTIIVLGLDALGVRPIPTIAAPLSVAERAVTQPGIGPAETQAEASVVPSSPRGEHGTTGAAEPQPFYVTSARGGYRVDPTTLDLIWERASEIRLAHGATEDDVVTMVIEFEAPLEDIYCAEEALADLLAQNDAINKTRFEPLADWVERWEHEYGGEGDE